MIYLVVKYPGYLESTIGDCYAKTPDGVEQIIVNDLLEMCQIEEDTKYEFKVKGNQYTLVTSEQEEFVYYTISFDNIDKELL